MNKKTILIFLLGFLISAVLFGVVCLAHRSATRVTELPQPAETLPLNTKIVPMAVAPPVKDVQDDSAGTPEFKTFLSSKPDAHSLIQEVKSGDTLTSIAKKYHVTVDIIRRINHLDGNKLFLGAKLKIPTYKLSVVVDKSQNTLILKGDEDILKTYIVSTGVNNSTPVGVFKITDKLVNPTWYKPDGKVIPYGNPANLLGARWMGLSKKGYGIHGTTEPEKLGQQITDGCVRMKNEDVEELYGFLIPGTEVTLVD